MIREAAALKLSREILNAVALAPTETMVEIAARLIIRHMEADEMSQEIEAIEAQEETT